MKRTILLAAAMVILFAAAAGIMGRLMPGPLKEADYFVIGSVATLVFLAGLFMLMVLTTKGGSGVFVKRRRK